MRSRPRRVGSVLRLVGAATGWAPVAGSLLILTVSPWGLAAVARADEPIRIELNASENVQGRCRLSFVVENKGEAAIDSLKLDLAIFNRDGVIQRRLLSEMGPVRRAKTIVKAFDLEGSCAEIGSILVNDVTACTPGDPGPCLDRLDLSSRLPAVRLFK
jgi:hypothetical protein